MFVGKNWHKEVRSIANEIDKAIRSQDFSHAKNRIYDLIKLTKHGDMNIKRDASIAVDNIVKRYGSTEPNDFLLPDWKGDFRGINKKVIMAKRTNNTTELKQIAKRMNTVVQTNINSNTRLNAIKVIISIAEFDVNLIAEFDTIYEKALVKEKDKQNQRVILELLHRIDADYPLDLQSVLKKLQNVEKTLVITPKYYYNKDFLLYRVIIKNNTEEILWDVRFNLKKYIENYDLLKIVPDFYEVIDGSTVVISVIQPNDSKEIIFTILPKAEQIYLEGTIDYRTDSNDKLQSKKIKNLSIDISGILNAIQPITDDSDKPSIIYCRELFDFHSRFKSSLSFAIPKSIQPKHTYEISKEILTNLKFINIMDVMSPDDNFYGESLFYASFDKESGESDSHLQSLTAENPLQNTMMNNISNNQDGKTNGKLNNGSSTSRQFEAVIVLRASNENYAIELNVACNNNKYLVATQVAFRHLLHQQVMSLSEIQEGDKLIELRCPSCLQSYDKLERDWCPWCGFDFAQ